MPRLSIQTKLAMLLSGLSLLLVGGILLVVQWSFDRGFRDYLNQAYGNRVEDLARELSMRVTSIEQLRLYAEDRSRWDNIMNQFWALQPPERPHRTQPSNNPGATDPASTPGPAGATPDTAVPDPNSFAPPQAGPGQPEQPPQGRDGNPPPRPMWGFGGGFGPPPGQRPPPRFNGDDGGGFPQQRPGQQRPGQQPQAQLQWSDPQRQAQAQRSESAASASDINQRAMPPLGTPTAALPPPPPPRRNRPPAGNLPLFLLDAEQNMLIGPTPNPPDLRTAPIIHEGHLLGYLGWTPVSAANNTADALFAARQHRLFVGVALAALVFSLILAWPLSRLLVRPIRRLSAAMHRLMKRDYAVQVPTGSRDELGDLAQDFNLMARTLNDYDQSRRQWLADVSHELRTPLGVLRGELEAIQDGVIDLDQQAVSSLVDEVRQLNGLVDDLHQLSVTDLGTLRYSMEEVDLVELLQRLQPRLQSALSQAKLQWSLLTPPAPLLVQGDPQRLEQLLQNLLQNSIRYTDPGGQVQALLVRNSKGVELIWEDSAPGVPAADLPHLFERFYRVEQSRQRALGGSGLGLAIVSNIVSAHGAQISAEASALGGLRVRILFPG